MKCAMKNVKKVKKKFHLKIGSLGQILQKSAGVGYNLVARSVASVAIDPWFDST